MLTSIRNASQGWLGRVVLGFILFLLTVAFAIWGISDVFRGFGRPAVATVGSAEITEERFRSEWDRARQDLTRRLGTQITTEQARLFGLPEEILGRMTAELALDRSARDLVLGVSDETVARGIVEDPAFRSAGARFDATAFRLALQQAGLTERAYLESRRLLTLRRQVAEAVAGRIAAPEVLDRAIHRFQAERRTIAYVALPADRFATIAPPDDAALTSYFELTRSAFRAPEYRKAGVLVLNAEVLAARVQVSDADVAQAYAARRATYVTPERRTLKQLTFPDRAAADAALARIRAGASFDAVATEMGRSAADVALGTLAASDVLDPAVRTAAFALAQGAVSDVVVGRFGPVLIAVDAIAPEAVHPLEAVADELRAELARERARRDVLDVHDRVEDERASGSRLVEVARKLDLPLIELDAIDNTGRDAAGVDVSASVGGGEVVQAIFRAGTGFDADPIQLRGQGFVWVDVQAVTPARDRSLDEVRGAVEERWIGERRAARMNDLARELVVRIDAGRPIAEVATELSLEAATSGPFDRSARPDDVGPGTVEAAFAVARGRAGFANAGADGADRIVFVVTAAETPDFSALDARLDRELDAAFETDLVAPFVTRLERDYGTRINRQVLDRVIGGQVN